MISVEEFLKEYAGQSVEFFIWEISELLADKIKKSSSPDESAKRILSEVSRFSGTFLRKNWQWAYDRLKIELEEIDKGKSIAEDLELTTIIPDNSDRTQDGTQQGMFESVDKSIAILREGNLSGWKLYYSDNKSIDPKHLVSIEGDALVEREKALEDFITKNQISSSIKPSSVINAFDWLVTIPKNIEEVRIAKDINGERFKKIKRGAVRIFYVMDEAKKQIIFFLHQKQAMSYGF